MNINMSSFEEIDSIFEEIGKIKHKGNFYKSIILDKLRLSNSNINYIIEKRNEISKDFKFKDFIMYNIIKNKTFTPDLLYNNPNLPWDYSHFTHRDKIDSNFILADLRNFYHNNWNIYELIPQFTFPELMIIFELHKDKRWFFSDNKNLMFLITGHEDFDFNILSINYSDGSIQRINMDEFIKHPKFEMYYVKIYPQFNWNWKLLTLHGKMTQEEAIKFMTYSGYRFFHGKMMRYFDNLMLQPWMNSWFIERYVSDPNNKRFYLSRLKKMEEYRTRSKNEELRWELVAKAMIPERIFDWYLDIHDLDNEFQDVLPEGHPRKRCIS